MSHKEYFINGTKANLSMILLIIPIVLFSVLPYGLIWGIADLTTINPKNFIPEIIFLCLSILFSFALHELIHGISWRCFVHDGWKSIQFGILWNKLTPYCHCKEVLTARQYRIGLLMPTIILGIIPTIIAWILGNGFLLFYAIMMTTGGIGDLMIYTLMSGINSHIKVKDHPKEIGFIIEEEEK